MEAPAEYREMTTEILIWRRVQAEINAEHQCRAASHHAVGSHWHDKHRRRAEEEATVGQLCDLELTARGLHRDMLEQKRGGPGSAEVHFSMGAAPAD